MQMLATRVTAWQTAAFVIIKLPLEVNCMTVLGICDVKALLLEAYSYVRRH